MPESGAGDTRLNNDSALSFVFFLCVALTHPKPVTASASAHAAPGSPSRTRSSRERPRRRGRSLLALEMRAAARCAAYGRIERGG
jgi:hypothetical protein